MTKIVIAGAAGRMGVALTRCIAALPDLTLVGAVERPDHPELGKDVGRVTGNPEAGVPLTSDLNAALEDADVLIDFTLHAAVPVNATMAARHGRAVVIGTTGLDEAETTQVHEAAAKVPIVWAPNMSLGINLLFDAVKKAASVLGSDYAVELEETHHIHKKDAPSGTALRLGEKVAAGFGRDFEEAMIHDPEAEIAAYPQDSIPIRSFRRGEVIGDHTVRFRTDWETVEFTHHAWSRDALAMGALRGAQWVVTRKPGLYDMQNVLGL